MKILNVETTKNKIKDKISLLRELKYQTYQFVIIEFDEIITESNIYDADSLAVNELFDVYKFEFEFTIADDQSDCYNDEICYKIGFLK